MCQYAILFFCTLSDMSCVRAPGVMSCVLAMITRPHEGENVHFKLKDEEDNYLKNKSSLLGCVCTRLKSQLSNDRYSVAFVI